MPHVSHRGDPHDDSRNSTAITKEIKAVGWSCFLSPLLSKNMSEKMNPEIKQKWVAALRSGEYKQGKWTLRDARGQYCCLGVLCSATHSKGWTGRSTLPSPIARKYGITTAAESDLVWMNDGEGRSFYEIADYIEEQL